MTFTDKKPTVPGDYAYTNNIREDPELVQIKDNEGELYAYTDEKCFSSAAWKSWGGLWSSRLVPVEEVGITHVSDEMIAEIANRMMRWNIPNDLISDACMLRKQSGRTGTNMIDVINAIALVQEVVKPVVEEYIQHARRVVEGKEGV